MVQQGKIEKNIFHNATYIHLKYCTHSTIVFNRTHTNETILSTWIRIDA